MKKLIVVGFLLVGALPTLAAALSDGSAEINKIKNDIANKTFQEANAQALADLLESYSPLTAGIGPVPDLVSSLENLISTMKNYLNNCGYYDTILKVLSKILVENNKPIIKLLSAWDKKPNFITKSRSRYFDFYKQAANLYLTLKLATEYLKTKNEAQRKANIAKIFDDISQLLMPGVPNSQELKDVPQKLSNDLGVLSTAFDALTTLNPTFIEEYCELEREYATGDWKKPDTGAEFRETLVDDDKDTEWGNFFEDQNNNAPEVIIMKMFISKKVQPLYGEKIDETSKSVQAWVGAGRDLLSKINQEIRGKKADPYTQADVAKFYQEQKDKIKSDFEDKIKTLAQETIIAPTPTYNQDKQDIIEEINALDLLDPNEKQALINLLPDEVTIGMVNKLLPKIPPAQQDTATVFLDQKLQEARSAANATTEYAGAKILKTLQADDLEKAITMFNLQTPPAPLNDPSPQAVEYRSIVKTYVDAANQLDGLKDLPPDQIKSNMLFPKLQSDIDTLKNSDKLNQLINWVAPEISLITAFEKALTEPIDPQKLIEDLNSLSISLMSLGQQLGV